MAELIHSAQSLMNAEDANIAKKKKNAEQMEARCMHHPKQDPLPKKAKIREKSDGDGKKVGSSSRRYSNYPPLNASLDQVLMHTKDDPSLKWPKKLKEDPSKWNQSKYFLFH